MRIMTYNILAEGLVRGGWTGMCLAHPACMRLPYSWQSHPPRRARGPQWLQAASNFEASLS